MEDAMRKLSLCGFIVGCLITLLIFMFSGCTSTHVEKRADGTFVVDRVSVLQKVAFSVNTNGNINYGNDGGATVSKALIAAGLQAAAAGK
jgi:predicted component of type VI protein secretion system